MATKEAVRLTVTEWTSSEWINPGEILEVPVSAVDEQGRTWAPVLEWGTCGGPAPRIRCGRCGARIELGRGWHLVGDDRQARCGCCVELHHPHREEAGA